MTVTNVTFNGREVPGLAAYLNHDESNRWYELDLIERRAEEVRIGQEDDGSGNGDNVYELCVGLCVSDEQDMDFRRWRQLEAAGLIAARYGDKKIDKFAQAVKKRKRTIQQYRQVYRFYPKDARRALLDECSNLLYSHFVTAMKVEKLPGVRPEQTVKLAFAFLEECAGNDWTPDHADKVMSDRIGKPTPVAKLVDGYVDVTGFIIEGQKGVTLRFFAPAFTDVSELNSLDGKRVRLVVYEPEEV